MVMSDPPAALAHIQVPLADILATKISAECIVLPEQSQHDQDLY